MPTIYLTCWNQKHAKAGPGRRFTIMAEPRSWEHGDGVVPLLVPTGDEVRMMKAALEARKNPLFVGTERITLYRQYFTRRMQVLLDEGKLAPGVLLARTGLQRVPVADGDTLACACLPDQECHRQWIAPYLSRAGWQVILDGREVRG